MTPNQGIATQYLQKGRASARARNPKHFDAADHPVEPKEIAALAQKQYQWAGSEYRYMFSHLLLAMMWVEGQHHLTLDPRTWKFVPIPQDEQIPAPMINLARDFVESMAGKLNKATPRGTVSAGNQDPRARLGAEKASELLAYKDERDKIDNLNRKRAKAGITCGDVFTETVIDKSNAEMVEIPVTAEMPGPDGQMQTVIVKNRDGTPVTERVAMADETTELILPIQLFTNPSGSELHEKRWVHSFAQQDLEFARQCFPDEADQIEKGNDQTGIGIYESRMMNLILREASFTGYGSITAPQSAFPGDPPCLVQVVRFKPDADYPEGRYFIVAGGVGVSGGPLPFGKYMMTHYRYSEVPGSFWSSGLVRDVMGLNRHVEKMMQQAALHRRTMGVPFWLIPERSGGSFSAGDILTKVGMIATYKHRPGHPPPQVVTPHSTMDSGFQAEVEMFLEKFLPTVAGTKSLSGDRPQGVYSAAFFKALAATASDRLSPKIDAWLGTIEEMNSQRLEAIKESPAWKIPQRINFPGRTGRRGMATISSADFADNLTYKIDTEARNSLDDATTTQTTIDLVKEGVIMPQSNPSVMYEVLKAVGMPQLIGEAAPDIRKAQDENAFMAMGEEAEFDETQNDEIHYTIHREYVQSPEYATLRLENPENAQIVMKHTIQTKQRVDFARQAADQRAASMAQAGVQAPPQGQGQPVGAQTPPAEAAA